MLKKYLIIIYLVMFSLNSYAAGSGDNDKPKVKSLIGQTLDDIGLTRYCCRRHFIGHIELIQYI